jgi:hypothetical protein
MSKTRLNRLLTELETGLSENFRKIIDYNNLCFQFSVAQVEKEIKDELELIGQGQKLRNGIVSLIAREAVVNLKNAFTKSNSPTLVKDKAERAKEVAAGKIFLSNKSGTNTFRALTEILKPVKATIIQRVRIAGVSLPTGPEGEESQFFNIEHLTTVSDIRMADVILKAAGSKKKATNLIGKIKQFSSPEAKIIFDEFILTVINQTKGNKGTIEKDLELKLEWKSEKRNKKEGREEIAARKRILVEELKRIISEQIKHRQTLGASDTVEELTSKKVTALIDEAIADTPKIKKKFRNTKIKNTTTKAKKVVKVPSKIKANKSARMGPSGISLPEKKAMPEVQGPSALEMLAYINSRLPDTVAKNMDLPGLQYQTGRFAQSVKALNVLKTKGGFPSIEYTYQRDPYQVFEMGAGRAPWATPDRDPRKLIDRSIREIAVELLTGRLYTRRV